jgi:hypothetical protein
MPLVSADMANVRQSVRKVAEMPADMLCPGHGEPIVGHGQAQSRSLLPAV